MVSMGKVSVASCALLLGASLADAKPRQSATNLDPPWTLSLDRSQLSIDGALEPDQMRTLLRPYELELGECLGTVDVKPPRLGRALLQFAIGDHGGVLTALVRDSEIQHRAIEQCIADKVRDWVFPLKLAEPILVTVPVVLSQESEEKAEKKVAVKRTRAPRQRDLTPMFGRDSPLGRDAWDVLDNLDGREVSDAYDRGEIVKLGRSSKHPQSGPVPDVRAAAPTVGSGLGAHDVQYLVERRMNELRFCYELGRARDARLAGSMTVRFVITPKGTSANALILVSTLSEKTMNQCVLAALQRWTYPRPINGSDVTVTQELTFSVPARP